MTLKLLHRYTNAKTYDDEQVALHEIAEANDISIHMARGRLVSMGIYNNKEKKATRKLKSTYVDQLVSNMEVINDTEYEYLERLTVALLKKIIKAVK